ncbi:MAG: prepilin-type N-terminal cleavage/methylation domain-containing protein, partial [bacterium]
MKNFFQKGVSFLEVMIVIAVIGIITVVAIPQLSKVRNVQILKSSSEDILSVLNKAHSQTLASLNSLQYGVHFETNRIIIFSGIVY